MEPQFKRPNNTELVCLPSLMSIKISLKTNNLCLGKKLVFVSEKHGDDPTGEGTLNKPYKTMEKYLNIFGEPDNTTLFFVDNDDESEKYMEIPKTRLKKIVKQYNLERLKAQKASKLSVLIVVWLTH